ncbi:hypothetical protein JCM10908_001840 [Rhodotorula pacifica]|uniref:uncharacterized protein n=1 Tax=Rhodotorula pacifica TaxID=1495444 RepID=UPI003171D76E
MATTSPADSGAAMPSFDSTIGPFVVGTFLALFLQGITLYNALVFWLNANKQKEPWFYRFAVTLVMVIDLMHSAFCINTIYYWCVDNFMNPAVIAFSPWSFTAEPILTGVMAAIVHLFYAHRLLTLAEDDRLSRPLFAFITLLTFLQLSFGIAVSLKIVEFDGEFVRFGGWMWGACVWLGAASANDIIICFSYLFYLNRTSKAMAGSFERSSKAVIKVAIIVLATNGLSALCAILATVLFGVFRHANWHAILQLTLAKLLALSLLIALNARTLLADILGVDPGVFQSVAKRHLPNNNSAAATGSSGSGIFKAKLAHATATFRNGPYAQAAEVGGFDTHRPPKSPGPSVVFGGSEHLVRGANGHVYPIKVSGLNRHEGGTVVGRKVEGNSDLDDEEDEDDAKDDFRYTHRESYARTDTIAFEDQIEHGSAHSRTPFVRSDSDVAQPHLDSIRRQA